MIPPTHPQFVRITFGSVVAALLLVNAAPGATVPFVSADVRSLVSGTVNSSGVYFYLDAKQATELPSTTIQTFVSGAGIGSGQVVGSDNQIDATWVQPDLGSAAFRFAASSNPLGNNLPTFVSSSSGLSYTFLTGPNPVVFTGVWSVGGDNPESLDPLRIVGFGVFPNMDVNPGTFEIPFDANTAYSIAFQPRILKSSSTAFDLDVKATATLNWSITAVPEPQNSAIVIILSGLALMRYRRVGSTVSA
jgi:hypothetical protein